jgi:hypothetical protein
MDIIRGVDRWDREDIGNPKRLVGNREEVTKSREAIYI